MLVTPRLVSWSLVLLTETKLTSAIGTTPTTSKAARTFCQNRIRGRRIYPQPPAMDRTPRRGPMRVSAWSASTRRTSHGTGGARTGKVLVRGQGAPPPGPRDSARVLGNIASNITTDVPGTHVEDKWPQGRSKSS